MKAVILRELGGPKQLQIESVKDPEPKYGEVLIKLKHAALNRRDVWITYGKYPGLKLPSILGSDGAGEVIETGEGVEGAVKGASVIINPALGWGDNPACANRSFSVLGMPVDGTYAEYITMPYENVHITPDYLTLEEAAAIPLGGLTAYRALFTRGRLKKNETVLIPGIGSGVALFLLQLAVAAGANVFVTSSSNEKLELAKQLGAAGGVNYRSENWEKEMRQLIGGGVDISIDAVGGNTFNSLVNLANVGGRIVSFGATSGAVPELVIQKVFLKHLDILGSTMGSPDDFSQMLQFFAKHEIHPVIDRFFSLDEIIEAQIYMEQGKQFGKIGIRI